MIRVGVHKKMRVDLFERHTVVFEENVVGGNARMKFSHVASLAYDCALPAAGAEPIAKSIGRRGSIEHHQIMIAF